MLDSFTTPAPLLPEILSLHGKWHSHRPAVYCEGQQLNWRELTASYHQIAHGLMAAGIKPGDRIGIVMSNGIPMLQAILATMAAGAVSVPINLSVTDPALANMMIDAQVSAIIASDDQRPRIDYLRSQLSSTITLFVDESGAPNWQSLSDIASQQAATLPDISLHDQSPMNIIYSSGTTGMPKGIVHSHQGRRDWAYDLCIALRYHSAAKTLLTIGLYSNISWVAMLCTLLAGGSLVIHKRFDARNFLSTVDTQKITHTAMVPIQFQRVIEHSDFSNAGVASMQAMMSCGSPLHAQLKEQIFSGFKCGIIELYGLTEGIITTLAPEEAAGRMSSVGKPLLGTDIAIIDENDKPANLGESGEIVSRGRITMPGYYQRDEANREASYIDDTGRQWLRSGDIGYLDNEGYLYIVDRKKDMILSGGQNIYPQDIEALLQANPDISDVAVIGVASERWGETPIALVVPTANAVNDVEALLLWANSRLGRQQRLTTLLLVDELPRNPNGKILKRELRSQYQHLRF